MLNKFISRNILILSSFLIILIFIFYSFFFASVTRTVDEDKLIKKAEEGLQICKGTLRVTGEHYLQKIPFGTE